MNHEAPISCINYALSELNLDPRADKEVWTFGDLVTEYPFRVTRHLKKADVIVAIDSGSSRVINFLIRCGIVLARDCYPHHIAVSNHLADPTRVRHKAGLWGDIRPNDSITDAFAYFTANDSTPRCTLVYLRLVRKIGERNTGKPK